VTTGVQRQPFVDPIEVMKGPEFRSFGLSRQTPKAKACRGQSRGAMPWQGGPWSGSEPGTRWGDRSINCEDSPMPKDWADDQSRSVVVPLRWIAMVFICPPRLPEPVPSEPLANNSSGSHPFAMDAAEKLFCVVQARARPSSASSQPWVCSRLS
jgi:hypothetical protein